MVLTAGCCALCCCQVTADMNNCVGPLRLRLSRSNVRGKEHQVILLTIIITVK
jgi:hypothetical protein